MCTTQVLHFSTPSQVLTYYPREERNRKILDFIDRYHLPIRVSPVEGVVTELRISQGNYIWGISTIMNYLREEYADWIAASA